MSRRRRGGTGALSGSGCGSSPSRPRGLRAERRPCGERAVGRRLSVLHASSSSSTCRARGAAQVDVEGKERRLPSKYSSSGGALRRRSRPSAGRAGRTLAPAARGAARDRPRSRCRRAAVGCGDEQRADGGVDDVEADVEETLFGGCGGAEALVEVRRDADGSSRKPGGGHRTQAAWPKGSGVESSATAMLLVGKVVGVAEHHCGALGRCRPSARCSILGVGGTAVLDRAIGSLRGRGASARVDHEPRRLSTPTPSGRRARAGRTRAGRAGTSPGRRPRGLAAEPPAQEAEHDVALLDVEALEGNGGHCFHHPL